MKHIRSRKKTKRAAGRELRLTEALRVAAKAVVATHDGIDWEEIAEADLDVVFLDFTDPESATAAERLAFEISACSDPGVVDDAIRDFRALSQQFIAPLSDFLSNRRQEDSRIIGGTQAVPPQLWKQLKSLSKGVSKMHRDFEQLLNQFARQGSRQLWPGVALTWQELNGILSGLDLVRRKASGLRAELARRKLVRGIPPDWIFRPLRVGVIERSGNTIKMKRDQFAAGRAVGLSREIARINTAVATLPVSASELDQVLRYDILFSRSGMLSFHFAPDEARRSLSKFQNKLEELIRVQFEFLRELRANFLTSAKETSQDERTSKEPPSQHSYVEHIASQHAVSPGDDSTPKGQSAIKEFRVLIYTATNVEVDGKRVINTSTQRALVGLRVIAGEKPGLRIPFSTNELISLTTPATKITRNSKIWNRYKEGLKEQMVGILIEGRQGYYTIHGLRFEDRLTYAELKDALRKLGWGRGPKSGDGLTSTTPPN